MVKDFHVPKFGLSVATDLQSDTIRSKVNKQFLSKEIHSREYRKYILDIDYLLYHGARQRSIHLFCVQVRENEQKQKELPLAFYFKGKDPIAGRNWCTMCSVNTLLYYLSSWRQETLPSFPVSEG